MHVGAAECAACLERGVSDVSQLNFTEQDKGKVLDVSWNIVCKIMNERSVGVSPQIDW